MTNGNPQNPETTSVRPKQNANGQKFNGKERMINGKGKGQMVKLERHFESPVGLNSLKDICSNETEHSGGTGEAEEVTSEVEEDQPEQNPGDARHMRKMADPCLPTRRNRRASINAPSVQELVPLLYQGKRSGKKSLSRGKRQGCSRRSSSRLLFSMRCWGKTP